jgi:hypothetical protein
MQHLFISRLMIVLFTLELCLCSDCPAASPSSIHDAINRYILVSGRVDEVTPYEVTSNCRCTIIIEAVYSGNAQIGDTFSEMTFCQRNGHSLSGDNMVLTVLPRLETGQTGIWLLQRQDNGTLKKNVMDFRVTWPVRSGAQRLAPAVTNRYDIEPTDDNCCWPQHRWHSFTWPSYEEAEHLVRSVEDLQTMSPAAAERRIEDMIMSGNDIEQMYALNILRMHDPKQFKTSAVARLKSGDPHVYVWDYLDTALLEVSDDDWADSTQRSAITRRHIEHFTPGELLEMTSHFRSIIAEGGLSPGDMLDLIMNRVEGDQPSDAEVKAALMLLRSSHAWDEPTHVDRVFAFAITYLDPEASYGHQVEAYHVITNLKHLSGVQLERLKKSLAAYVHARALERDPSVQYRLKTMIEPLEKHIKTVEASLAEA